MKNILVSLLLCVASAAASADVINFDDLAGDETVAIGNGYQGFDWDNAGAIGADAYPGSGYDAGVVSAGNVAFNRDGGTLAIMRAGGFKFVGAYFTSAWLEQELAFEGYAGGQLLVSSSVSYLIDTTTPRWIELGWSGIDMLVIYNSSGTQWAMDDFTVPEPASLGLFGACLGLLALTRRHKFLPQRTKCGDIAA